MKESLVSIVLFVGAFVLGVITDHYINTLLFDSGSLLEQSKTALKTETASSERVFVVDGKEYVCHNNADFNYTTRTCYFSGTKAE